MTESPAFCDIYFALNNKYDTKKYNKNKTEHTKNSFQLVKSENMAYYLVGGGDGRMK